MSMIRWEYKECVKCGKEFSTFKLKTPTRYFIKCCNKTIDIKAKEMVEIQNFKFKCKQCNQIIKCIYAERKCPHCGAINIEEKCFKPSTQEERDKRLREQIKSGILY